MTDERAYRVVVRFDQDHFVARVPELGLSAEGPSRAEAIAKLETAVEARIQAAADGEPLPPPIDTKEVSGTLELKLPQSIVRDLAFFAAQDGSSVEALAAALIARGLGAMDGGRGQRRGPPPREDRGPPPAAKDGEERQPVRNDHPGDRGNDRGGNRRDRRQREGYRPELDDKANFLEYLRGLDKGGGGGGRNRGGR
ncbi:MAG: hypothetical protein U1E65_08015 [Myxococcota bacterium]